MRGRPRVAGHSWPVMHGRSFIAGHSGPVIHGRPFLAGHAWSNHWVFRTSGSTKQHRVFHKSTKKAILLSKSNSFPKPTTLLGKTDTRGIYTLPSLKTRAGGRRSNRNQSRPIKYRMEIIPHQYFSRFLFLFFG